MSLKEVGADFQYVLVSFSHVYDIMMNEKVILVVREPDVEKAYSRIQLLGNVQILRLRKSHGPVNTARIMGPRNTQCRHKHLIRNVSHPGIVGNDLARRAILTGHLRAVPWLHLVGVLVDGFQRLMRQLLTLLKDLVSYVHRLLPLAPRVTGFGGDGAPGWRRRDREAPEESRSTPPLNSLTHLPRLELSDAFEASRHRRLTDWAASIGRRGRYRTGAWHNHDPIGCPAS